MSTINLQMEERERKKLMESARISWRAVEARRKKEKEEDLFNCISPSKRTSAGGTG